LSTLWIRSCSLMAIGGASTGAVYPELNNCCAGLRVSDTGFSGE
jgi:hypothetical protein